MQSLDSNYIVPPFPPFPSAKRYVPLGSVQDAMERVCRAVDAREAVSLVIGPPGTGKSLICGLLQSQFKSTHDVVVLGETPITDSATFYRHLLHHLGADIASIPDGDLQLALVNRVCKANSTLRGLLIIVDEAQSLTPEVIEAIRMVTNITRAGEPRVFAVLCGGVKLDDTLVASSLEAFTQRAATRCYLHPLNSQETRQYITQAIRNCGADADETITDEAIAAVHHACSGVPRLINQLLTQAIDCAADADQTLIDERIIDRAWAELQQLPSPMVVEPKFSNSSSPVEYGELSESNSASRDGEHYETDYEPTNSSIDVGIEVETATAMWIDEEEPASHSANTAVASTVELFGEFDDEEEVAVGSTYAAKMTPLNRSFANVETPWQHGAIDVGNIAMVELRSQPSAALADQAPIQARDAGNCCEKNGSVEAGHGSVLRLPTCRGLAADDRDILVIEDELELSAQDSVTRVDGERQTISVDFHQMLAKMRSGA
jgi:type II secretory pathway predicted ATPase ExeA